MPISGKKCWCQQNPRGTSRDSYSFWNFFRQGVTVPSFIIVGYVWQILERGGLFALPPHPWLARKKSILNRVKSCSLANFTFRRFLINLFQNISPPKSFLNTLAIFLAIYQSQSKQSRLVVQKNLWMGFNCLKTTEPLWGDSLLFTTKLPGVPGTQVELTVEG